LLSLVSIKAFIGLTRTFSVLKLTGYSYNMMTSFRCQKLKENLISQFITPLNYYIFSQLKS